MPVVVDARQDAPARVAEREGRAVGVWDAQGYSRADGAERAVDGGVQMVDPLAPRCGEGDPGPRAEQALDRLSLLESVDLVEDQQRGPIVDLELDEERIDGGHVLGHGGMA